MTEIARISRRRLLRLTGCVTAGFPALWLACKSEAAPPQRKSKSRVALARRDGVLLDGQKLDRPTVRELLDRAVAASTGRKDADVAWKTLFSPRDRVGLKVNALGGAHLSPHPELIDAIAERLLGCGIPAENILVWDRFERELHKARLVAPSLTSGVRVAATDSQGAGYTRSPEMSGSIGSCFSRILTQFCTAMINVGVLKDHDLSGTSIGLKNLFGVIHNPNKYHFDVNKDPYLADVCLHPHVRDKQRLVICDAFRPQCDGGPAYHPAGVWEYSGLLASTDIVAIDAIGTDIVESRRGEQGLPTLKEAEREPLYFHVAEEKKIGWADRSRIEVIEIS